MLDDFSAPIVAIFCRNICKFFFDDTEHLLGISKNLFELFDEGLYGTELILDLLALESGELLEFHIEDGECLLL